MIGPASFIADAASALLPSARAVRTFLTLVRSLERFDILRARRLTAWRAAFLAEAVLAKVNTPSQGRQIRPPSIRVDLGFVYGRLWYQPRFSIRTLLRASKMPNLHEKTRHFIRHLRVSYGSEKTPYFLAYHQHLVRSRYEF